MKNEIRTLIEKLNEASVAYYAGNPAMSDHEWDRGFDQLKKLEEDSGIVYPDSPTQRAGAEVVTELRKVTHQKPALSQDKIKYENREDLIKWLGDNDAVMSWKCDGSTVVLTYNNGELVQAATRGNGIEGSDITHNARFFSGVPTKIPYQGNLIVRGEAMMSYAEFERINALYGGVYENPRNLATATIQMLDANESRKRKIIFKAFELVAAYGLPFFEKRLDWLEALGFDVVDHRKVDATDILAWIEEWKEAVKTLEFPTDGLVIAYNDVTYAESLGATGHHYRGSIALKWTDETKKSILRNVSWSVGKTGVITPVAEFDSVRLGAGSTITRASLHNISCLRNVPIRSNVPKGDLEYMCLGDSVDVYLANMIIPQIASYGHDGEYTPEHPRTSIEIPRVCPVCGAKTVVTEKNGVATLHCTSKDCAAQRIGAFMNSFSKDGLFVKGLGESQIEDLIGAGLLTKTADIFKLPEELPEELLRMDGWGKKKWDNLLAAVNAARETTLQKFLYSLNIPLLGNDLSKKLAKYFDNDIKSFAAFILCFDKSQITEKLTAIDGVGAEKAANIADWAFQMKATCSWGEVNSLIKELHFPEADSTSEDNSLEGLTFVITGSVHEYKNRDEFKASVEARGGKVSGSVSAKTSYLVNNDVESTSGKNKKAKEIGIEIISEDEFISRFGK